MIAFIVELGDERIPLDEIDIAAIREVFDPIRDELLEKVALAPDAELSVVFKVDDSGEIGIEFRGDPELIDRLDDVLEDMELSDPEDG